MKLVFTHSLFFLSIISFLHHWHWFSSEGTSFLLVVLKPCVTSCHCLNFCNLFETGSTEVQFYSRARHSETDIQSSGRTHHQGSLREGGLKPSGVTIGAKGCALSNEQAVFTWSFLPAEHPGFCWRTASQVSKHHHSLTLYQSQHIWDKSGFGQDC